MGVLSRLDDSRRSALFAAVVAVVFGLGVTVAAVSVLAVREASQRAATVNDEAERAADALQAAISAGETRTSALTGLFVASADVARDEFTAFGYTLGPSPGLASLGFALRVPVDSARATISGIEPATDDDGAVSGLDDPMSDHYVEWFTVSFAEPSIPVGSRDLSMVPSVRNAIERSIVAEGPAFSSVGECSRGVGCVIVNVGPAPEDDDLRGVVFSVVDLGLVLDREVASATTLEAWSFARADGGRVTSEASPTLWRDRLEVGDQSWALQLTTVPYTATATTEVRVASAMGAIMSLFAGFAAHEAMAGRTNARLMAHAEMLRRERDRFLAALAHELRTPLTGSLAAQRLLTERWRDYDSVELAELLDIAERQTTELSDIVDDLLLVARSDTETLEFRAGPIDLLAETSRILLRCSIPDALTVSVGDGDALAFADPGRVRQILRNLIANGVRHASSTFRIDGMAANGTVSVVLRNDGPPLGEETRRRMFEVYAVDRTPGESGAIGIGLHVSRVLAEAMGGSLSYSHDGDMCVFTLELPAGSDVEKRLAELRTPDHESVTPAT